VTHSKNNTSVFYGLFDAQTVVDGRSHGFLTQDMIALLRKCESDFHVHLVMNSDDNRICQTLSDGSDRFCRGSEEILPGGEDEGLVDVVEVGELTLGVGSGLGHSHDPALMRV